jgi:hypothetical protein
MSRLRCVFVGIFALVLATSVPAEARNCKPNFKGKDRITKVEFAEWTQMLYKTGFLSSVVASTSEINITGTVVRMGDANRINIILEKEESNPGRAVVESPYKAEKGNEFLFGFKEGGEPLQFLADSVGNDTRADMFGNIKTKVILTANISPEARATLKDALATKHIDSVRVSLSNNLIVEQSVNEDNSEAFTAKIQCWLAFPEAKASP